MGKRSSRWRAAWADTWTNPWRGLGWGERRRLTKLARSGEPIADRRDADLVHDYVFWMRRFVGRLLIFGASLVVLDLVLEAVNVLSGNAFRVTEWTVRGVLYIAAVLFTFHILNKERRTSEANGWEGP